MATSTDDGYEISNDAARIDYDRVHHWLTTDTYWARGRDRATVDRAAGASLNFGVYGPAGDQVGYARVVTDLATFAWVSDVYIDRDHRGLGLGGRLAAAIRDHLAPYRLKRVLLATRDAQEVYARVGFQPYDQPEQIMVMGFAP
ncbi:GNAT family N-acetyltransferase [Streptomyces specialis]|uniref:GNAT family N-acetyltransferase n=1 Tax=Streptomyces specialis TaxID=498367 RepID=UPI00073E157B|nr:GNAT family N-acetyltransferase [Streptomyces specialis]